MPRPISCRVTDRPDGRFDVLVTMPSCRPFRRAALMTRAEADASVDDLRDLMAAIGAPLHVEERPWNAGGTPPARRRAPGGPARRG